MPGDAFVESSIVSSASLEAGLVALQQGQLPEAVGILEAFCHDCAIHGQTSSRDYLRAQMHLVKIYEQQGHAERVAALCQQLANCSNAQVKIWVQQYLVLNMQTASTFQPAASVPGTWLGKFRSLWAG
jgi:hypothetical protein